MDGDAIDDEKDKDLPFTKDSDGDGIDDSIDRDFVKTVAVEVTLIEPNISYVSPILSNLVLNNQKTTTDLTFSYQSLQQKYGVNLLNSAVTGVDKTNQTITLALGSSLGYDRLVMAPGIDFIYASGHDPDLVPHAWKAGAQTNLLKAQLDAIPNGGHFVMTIPGAPYRCPPGPYERACVVADYQVWH